MKQYARVIRQDGEDLLAVVKRESACGGNCMSCAGCADSNLIVRASHDGRAKAGDIVVISMPARYVLSAAFLVYIVPLLFLLGSYLAAYALTENQVVSGVVCAGVFLFSFGVLKILDRRLGKNGKYRAALEEVIK